MHHYTKVGSGDKLPEESDSAVCSVHRVEDMRDTSTESRESPLYKCTQSIEIPLYKCTHTPHCNFDCMYLRANQENSEVNSILLTFLIFFMKTDSAKN